MTADSPHRRMSFDRNAGNYHQGRPPYPQRVYGLLADEYGLGPGCRIVEIGAGSGTATAELLDRGGQITAIEPGSAFVDLLRGRHPSDRLTVVQADFEHAVLPVASFDLAVAATSWHWVNPAIAIPKVAQSLRPGGGLVVWWTVFGNPHTPTTEFRAMLDPLYARFMPHERHDGQPPQPMRVNQWREQLQAGDWFQPPQVELVRWTQRLSAASARALWATFPNVAELSEPDRDAFLRGVCEAVETAGGAVDDARVTIVYHTRRTDSAGSQHMR